MNLNTKDCVTSFGVFAALALAGCGGSHGGSTASGSGQQSAARMAPKEVQGTAGGEIYDVAPNGHMIGLVQQVPTYWSSPAAAPQTLPLGGFLGVVVCAVNRSGQIVGFANQGIMNADYIPVYWSSPTSTPVALQLPSGGSQARCFGLNASGQIVGDCGNASSPVSWASPTSAPVILSAPSGSYSNPSQALRVSDSGIIFGVHGTVPLVWTSPQAQPQQLSLPNGTAFNGSAGQTFAMNQATGEAGGSCQAGGNPMGPILWAQPGFALAQPPSPSGFTGYSSIADIGPNQALVGQAGSGATTRAVIWTSPSAPFKNLANLVPTAPGWKLLDAEFMTDDGTIIGTGTDPDNNWAWFVTHM